MELLVLSIPLEYVGRIIGKQGFQIKSLREQSNCDIIIDTSQPNHPVARIRGESNAINFAKNLILNLCNDDNSYYLKDVDEHVMSILNKNNFLQTQQAKAQVSTELLGRTLKITSLNENLRNASSFKSLLENHLLMNGESISSFTDKTLVNEFKMGKRTYLMTCQTYIPLYKKLFKNCSAQKRADLKLDLEKLVCKRLNVYIQSSNNSSKLLVSGCSQRSVYDAAKEIENLLQYYFRDNCAIIPITLLGLNLIYKTFLSALFGEKVIVKKPEVCYSVDPINKRFWICGSPTYAAVVYKSKLDNQYVLACNDNFQLYEALKSRVYSDQVQELQRAASVEIIYECDEEKPTCVWICGNSQSATRAAKESLTELLKL